MHRNSVVTVLRRPGTLSGASPYAGKMDTAATVPSPRAQALYRIAPTCDTTGAIVQEAGMRSHRRPCPPRRADSKKRCVAPENAGKVRHGSIKRSSSSSKRKCRAAPPSTRRTACAMPYMKRGSVRRPGHRTDYYKPRRRPCIQPKGFQRARRTSSLGFSKSRGREPTISGPRSFSG